MNTTFCQRMIVAVAMILVSSGLAGCAQGTAATSDHQHAMASMADMPAEVQSAPVTVQAAYQFAVANPQVLQELPCYCGCGKMGHTSNYSCYVENQDAAGQITFDNHALGCSICVDITTDAMRMLDQGKPIGEIRAAIDNTYSKYGPSNIP